MRFDLDDEQRAIQDSVRQICRRHQDLSRDRESGGTDLFWTDLAASGWAGIAVPEAHGGQGLGVLELSLVMEELGYALAPATFMGNAAGGLLIATAGDEEDRDRWLAGVASGDQRAALAVNGGDGGVALDAEGAALLVAATDDGVRVVEPLPWLEPQVDALDLSRSCARADLSDARLLRTGDRSGADSVEVLIAADMVGVAQHAMELAVEHAKSRVQFGRPIGAYQAVSHRCADMLVAVESARSAVLSAAWTADHEPERLAFTASVAKVTAIDAAWSVTTSALQVHGGMGFTWEHPVHRFLRRAALSARLLRTSDEHLERLAAAAGLHERGAV